MWVGLNCHGMCHQGGYWLWYKRMVEKMDECVGEFMMAISFKNAADEYLWAFMSVYGPN